MCKNQFEKAVREVLESFDELCESHAISKDKKERITSLTGFIKALLRGDVNKPLIQQKINELIDDIFALTPVTIRTSIDGKLKVLPNLGDIRKRIDAHELLCLDGIYRLKNLQSGEIQIANGPFVFVVPVATPYRILVGQRIHGGHTAISRGSDVYYAGEMTFVKGQLKEWKNESGHYLTSGGLQTQIRNLLPLDKFHQVH